MVQRTIRGLAEFICGNKEHGKVESYEGYRQSNSYDVPGLPRKNQDIQELLVDAVPGREQDIKALFDAGTDAKLSKRDKTIHALKEFCEAERKEISEPLEYILCELAAPRTYKDKQSLAPSALLHLNQLLEFEGVHILLERGRPKMMSITSLSDVIPEEPPKELDTLISEAKLRQVLKETWRELMLCRASKAHTAAMILLGTILEGLLRNAADGNQEFMKRAMSSKSGTSYSGDPTLAELIPAADAVGIISADRMKNLDSVREIRNLVHPARRVKAGNFAPDSSSVEIGLQVLKGIIQDLSRQKV